MTARKPARPKTVRLRVSEPWLSVLAHVPEHTHVYVCCCGWVKTGMGTAAIWNVIDRHAGSCAKRLRVERVTERRGRP